MNESNTSQIQISVNRGSEVWPYDDPPLFEPYWFEKFNFSQQINWMENNYQISYYICAIYLILIFAGKKFMENRKAFDLRRANALWNFGFFVFSVTGLVRCIPELLHVLSGNNGFHRSVCVRDSLNEPAAFWATVFTLSKVVELGDTAFMVLRKKPVYPVHYIHHGLALILVWSLYPIFEPVLRYLGDYNFFLHSVLYGYLFLKTIGVTMPKYFSKIILSLEMLQLIIGLIVNLYATWIKTNGQECAHRTDLMVIETFFYLIYGTVLVTYFTKSYNRSRAKVEKTL